MNENYLNLIETAVKEGYIEGIHRKQDKNQALKGFHRDFEMIVLNKDQIEKVDIDKWLDRIESMKEKSPALWKSPTDYRFSLLDNTDNTAVVKIDVFKGKVHFSTDYMLLYKIEEEWKIVSKIFSVPE
ncbi:MAG TPA: nuclear transport factor 2 family protein [Clostridia bacterium]|nr:nuclear transport factor 2 family protein [Clostridia bacterium]